MHVILDKDGECIGQYLRIRNDEYTVRMFTKYYNMFIEDAEFFISEKDVKNLLRFSKYNIKDNDIYIHDLQSGDLVFRSLDIGLNMVWVYNTKKLYLLTELELNKFIKDNTYKSETTMNYVFGIAGTYKFRDVKVIISNNITNAKNEYKKLYNINEDPVFIGFQDEDYLYITLDRQSIAAAIDQDIIL